MTLASASLYGVRRMFGGDWCIDHLFETFDKNRLFERREKAEQKLQENPKLISCNKYFFSSEMQDFV